MFLEKLRLDGRNAIVTGGGTGLGRAMALALAKAGADVAVAARRVELIEAVAAELRKLGRRALALPADVTDPRQVGGMVAKVIAEWGAVDILVNNAGVVREWVPKPIWEITDEEWRLGIDTNLSSAFYCSRAVSKHMAERGTGVIINLSSGFGLRAMRDNYMYCSAKAGVINFTRTLAFSLAQFGIRVHCIAPGFFATIPQAHEYSYEGKFIPVGRVGDPQEIGSLAVYLASDVSAYATGDVFCPDGAALAGGYGPTGFAPELALIEEP